MLSVTSSAAAGRGRLSAPANPALPASLRRLRRSIPILFVFALRILSSLINLVSSNRATEGYSVALRDSRNRSGAPLDQIPDDVAEFEKLRIVQRTGINQQITQLGG